MNLTFASIETMAGIFRAGFTAAGLARLEFPPPGATRPGTTEQGGADLNASQRRWLRQTRQALNVLLAGRPVKELPPLDVTAGTSFQQSVWRALQSIPAGETRTYGEIACSLGRPRAMRAVGQACGANPIPVLVPCHRVLGAGGALGGFSGGLEWKRRLLAGEGRAV